MDLMTRAGWGGKELPALEAFKQMGAPQGAFAGLSNTVRLWSVVSLTPDNDLPFGPQFSYMETGGNPRAPS